MAGEIVDRPWLDLDKLGKLERYGILWICSYNEKRSAAMLEYVHKYRDRDDFDMLNAESVACADYIFADDNAPVSDVAPYHLGEMHGYSIFQN